MIIEIKDLPSGRKVSRILVDITFEDSQECEEGSLSSKTIDTSSTITKAQGSAGSAGSVSNASAAVEETNRKPVDIPDEMLNMEF